MRRLLILTIALLGRLLGTRRAEHPPKRVLLIKPDHLGDLLLATPALADLRRSFPAAEIHALVGPWSRLIWERSPELDAIDELPFPGFDRSARPGKGLWRWAGVLRPYLLLAKYALLLRRRHYDAALILRDDHWWGAALAVLAGVPHRIGHAHPLCAPLLSDAQPYVPREHVSRQALALVERLAVVAAEGGGERQSEFAHANDEVAVSPALLGVPPLHFAPTPEERTWAEGWIAERLRPGERLLVIHPGTGGPTKHWPEERWPAVLDALARLPGSRLLLTGGPGEAELVGRIAQRVSHPPLTLAGQTSVGQLAALLGRAALVLGVDSGPLHIAVSQGVPTLHLFGPSDHERFGPWGDPARHVVLRAGLFCSPCGVFSHCPRGTAGPECMDAIEVVAVVAAAWRLLDG